jgi:hypothetical protein
MAIIPWLERVVHGDGGMVEAWRGLGDQGRDAYNAGQTLTDEGLGNMRGLNNEYRDRLKDPLGAAGRGIFTRARGKLNDDSVRGQRSFSARITQRAAQSGGTMSPEAIAELEAQNARDINEAKFTAGNEITQSEAGLTLQETGRLFDRMEGINRMIAGIGQDERSRGLQTILNALLGRQQRHAAIASTVMGGVGAGASYGGSSSGGGAGANAGAGG